MFRKLFAVLFLISVTFSSHAYATNNYYYAANKQKIKSDAIAVTNRGSGTLSLINTRTLRVETVDLTINGQKADPMYVNHWRGGKYAGGNRIFVGDRANNRMIVLDDRSRKIVGTIPVGAGVFHQWVQPKGRQLWVIGDIDKTVSVINPVTLKEIKRIHIPKNLGSNAKPHDVFVTRWYAYVSIVGLDNGESKVLRYNTWNFALSGKVNAGGDAHLFVMGKRLYVPSQDDSKVRVFNTHSLKLLSNKTIPNAHGITSNRKTRQVLVTNIAEGGNNAVYALSKNGKRVFGAGSTNNLPKPHNVALDRNARNVFVTHSGADSNKVSVMRLRNNAGPVAKRTVTVGFNPFGIGLIENIPSHRRY